MHELAELLHRRARPVLVATVVITLIAGVLGAGVIGSLTSGGTSDPHAPSVLAARQITAATGVAPLPEVVVLVRTSVAAPRGRALVARVVHTLRSQSVIARVVSFLDVSQPSGLVSRDGSATLVLAYFGAGTSEHADIAAVRRVQSELRGAPGVTVGGEELTFSQLEHTISTQLPQVELIAFSILLVLSLLAFRGLVAALLPLMVGAIAVAGSLLIMRALTQVTSMSVYSLNLVTGLGLGLAIDYSLFIVYRYREELTRSGHCAQALARTVSTAGRTVVFSASTVSVALLSLLVFPQRFLSSMGIAAALVTVLAATAALIPLGAVLTLLGPRVNALSPRWLAHTRRRAQRPVQEGRWYRLAGWVMRRPARVAIASAALLLCVGLPALHLRLGAVDARVLPPGSSARVVEAAIDDEFAADASHPILAVMHAPAGAGPALARYRERLARLPGVAVAQAPARIAPRLWRLEILSRHPPLSAASQHLIGRIHLVRAPYAVELTGVAAGQFDEHTSLRSHIALALTILAATTLLVLFAMTGSVVLAVKSLIMNLLTLSAAFGILVLVFQDGHLQGLLGYTATGSLEQTNMIILFIIGFGLSTDYGVFLLARIKEMHDAGAGDELAVATGLERSGRVVSAAAVLFCAAVGSLAASSVSSLKEFG
ncbi:MAG TPA: MMPL family transporter, partial [Solirubrobacteraceae bacterium]|nr:MMPL family transporter [Solirubrobacteraceae bacterium]